MVKDGLHWKELQTVTLKQEREYFKRKLFVSESKLKQIEKCLFLYSNDTIDVNKMVNEIDKVLDLPDE